MQSIERYDRGSSVVEYPVRQLGHLPTDAGASRYKRTRICHYGCFWDWLLEIAARFGAARNRTSDLPECKNNV
ncbi:hypothetical protein BB560_006420 [Smittium megazygosporum]|uniref:Uncharacterized protein n=1 Tax=Smittium megazygosporum TaxID=133381 RepID=A0A2T9Y6F2_9FUNG|nr:hypothetical protein BB560_006420 [Smittium megazygosporum]